MSVSIRTAVLLALACFGSLVVSSVMAAESHRVRVETSAGSFVVQLDAERAPISVENFLRYARDDFYAGTIFHRVVNGFIIQGGGFAPDMTPKTPRASIPNESGNGLANLRGTIAMARQAQPHTADAQFYINLADNIDLDPKPTRWGYAVFGRVVEGMDVIDDIGHRATSGADGLPDAPVVIRKVVIVPDTAP